jgi:hypothetical protein
MAQVSRHVAAPPDRVLEILADGWTYAGWVVGTAHIRAVDPHWPAPGSRIQHAIGPWPVVIRDSTTMREFAVGRRLLMRVRLWPVGEGDVEFVVDPEPGGVGSSVTMTETVVKGPWRLLGPVTDSLLHARNVETLDRLAALAEHRTRAE